MRVVAVMTIVTMKTVMVVKKVGPEIFFFINP